VAEEDVWTVGFETRTSKAPEEKFSIEVEAARARRQVKLRYPADLAVVHVLVMMSYRVCGCSCVWCCPDTEFLD